ncbi:hypothetical protein GCM10025777_48250 [Membranihabitans marinus]|uniref:Uncharacterized protein n=1 Tax=Nesterenkonia rhizosphaerae TaxID=1348272 RepID=A0ABP9FYA6_9MICC
MSVDPTTAAPVTVGVPAVRTFGDAVVLVGDGCGLTEGATVGAGLGVTLGEDEDVADGAGLAEPLGLVEAVGLALGEAGSVTGAWATWSSSTAVGCSVAADAGAPAPKSRPAVRAKVVVAAPKARSAEAVFMKTPGDPTLSETLATGAC